MRPIQPPDEQLRESLKRALGHAVFAAAHAEGAEMAPVRALQPPD